MLPRFTSFGTSSDTCEIEEVRNCDIVAPRPKSNIMAAVKRASPVLAGVEALKVNDGSYGLSYVIRDGVETKQAQGRQLFAEPEPKAARIVAPFFNFVVLCPCPALGFTHTDFFDPDRVQFLCTSHPRPSTPLKLVTLSPNSQSANQSNLSFCHTKH